MSKQAGRPREPYVYQITIAERLHGKWASWLSSANIAIENLNTCTANTAVTVSVPDQAALRGILNRLWDLNLTLIAVILQQDQNTKGASHE